VNKIKFKYSLVDLFAFEKVKNIRRVINEKFILDNLISSFKYFDSGIE
jgi:hypothetical protein